MHVKFLTIDRDLVKLNEEKNTKMMIKMAHKIVVCVSKS